MKLKYQWEKEQPIFSSNSYDYWEGSAAKSIIAMGKKALPFIMKEIENGNFLFIVAAERITQIKMRNQTIQSEQENSKYWLKWWQENKNNPVWNIYLK